jgi:hypothetical protein
MDIPCLRAEMPLRHAGMYSAKKQTQLTHEIEKIIFYSAYLLDILYDFRGPGPDREGIILRR